MRLLLTGMTLLIALVLLAPVGVASAPKPSKTTAAAVVFRNAADDAIKSDALGAYIDGNQRGLEVRMWTCADCSQDLTIGTFTSGRTLYFNYNGRVSGSGPIGTMNDNAFMNVRDIATMVPGETKITRASFNTSVGYFRWLSGPPPTHGGSLMFPSNGSHAVEVTRSFEQPDTWSVVTPVPTVPYGVDYYAGDLSVLMRDAPRNTTTVVGLYHMPFALTVTCPECP